MTVRFERPDWEAIRDSGLMAVDMHFHTNCSDSFTDIDAGVRLAAERGVGIAVTDHNLISSLVKIKGRDLPVPIIPGMEVSTSDGPHILVYFYEMADDYREAILDIMKKKGVTQEKLSLELGVDRKAIYNFLNVGAPSVEHMVGVCVALKLPYFVSMKLIQNAGSALRRTELHHLYRQFLMQADRLSVERCNDILIQKKYLPLFQGKNG